MEKACLLFLPPDPTFTYEVSAMPTNPDRTAPVVFTGTHCDLQITRPTDGVVLIVFTGHDIGEFGDAPFRELAYDLRTGRPIEVFVDARNVPGTSIDVSGSWAQWMIANRERLHRLSILCGSRFIELTANFVRQFTEFGPRMRIYTETSAFEEALRAASDGAVDG